MWFSSQSWRRFYLYRLFVQNLEYGKAVHVDLLLKHVDNSNRLFKAGVDKIDYHIPERYTRQDLQVMLGLRPGATE